MSTYLQQSTIDLIPPHLHEWAAQLTESDVAAMIRMVGNAAVYILEPEVGSVPTPPTPPIAPSATIGIQGETEVYNLLKLRYEVDNTAKAGKRGDFIISIDGIRLLIEVKKYSSTVPHSEVEKFYRDMDANASVSGGIMISLTSKIVGVVRGMEYRRRQVNGLPIIYLCPYTNDRHITPDCIHTAIDILHTDVMSRRSSTCVSDEISYIVENIDKDLDYISQCRNVITETQAMFNKQFTKMTQCVLNAEVNIKHSLMSLKSKVVKMHADGDVSSDEKCES